MRQFLLLICWVSLVGAKCGRRGGRTIFDSDEDTDNCGSIFDSVKDDSSAACERGGNGSGCCLKKSHSVDISTAAIARLLIDAGNQMQRFCTAHSDRTMREVYGVEHFQLRVRLTEFSEDHIEVRVRQRLVLVYARSCTEEFAAVRILPEVANAHGAVWKFDGGNLTVLFPYNITPNTQIQSRCGRGVSDDLITVPQCAAGTTFDPDYDVFFEDANLRAAMRRYLADLATKTPVINNESNNDYVEDDK